MKKQTILLFAVLCTVILFLCACSADTAQTTTTTTTAAAATHNSGGSSSGRSSSETSGFSNSFGTPNTKCAHPGCDNYIASSGDTNCCVTHSNRCLECGKYIDEDAMYCMSCLSSAAGASSTTKFENAYGSQGTTCAHPGCNNPIASSGDTNCCATHSNRCLECGKYIDEDAMYCISCLSKAASSTTTTTKSYYSNSSSSYGSSYGSSYDTTAATGAGGYEMPNENDKSFSDYVKRVDPDLYDSLFD